MLIITMIVNMAMMVMVITISNDKRVEWSPIRSVIIGVFVNYEYDYRQNWTTRRPVTT